MHHEHHDCDDPICQAFDRGYSIGTNDARDEIVRYLRGLRSYQVPTSGTLTPYEAARLIETHFGGVNSGA